VVDDAACPRVNGTLMCAFARLDGNPRVTIVSDNRTELMHHKYMVVDGARLWVGSANLSFRSFCIDANNGIIVDDPAIVGAYESEFQRMFTQGSFGPIATTAPTVSGAYTAYMSPRAPVTTAPAWHRDLIAAINAATTTIDFEMSVWTRTDIGNALVAAHQRGVRVRGAVDTLTATNAVVQTVRAAGVPLRTGNVHSKVLIVDGRTVFAGSANWTFSAWANNENVLAVSDPAVATRYTTDFETVYARLTP